MVTISQNSEIAKRILRDLKISISDGVPSQISNQIVPVLISNPERTPNIIKQASAINSTSSVIYTTPTDRDFYLTNVNIANIKDVTSTSALSYVACLVNGAPSIIVSVSGLTLTPSSASNTISFPYPIKIDRGTQITVNNSTNIANVSTTASIIGYTIDPY